MIKKIFFGIIAFIVIILYFHYGDDYMDKRDLNNYNKFNRSNLDGVILDLKEYARGVKLQFEHDTVVFYPQTSKLNDNNIFIFTAKKGDKVVKKPFQDTLLLQTKNGLKLKYTFFDPQKESSD